MEWTELLTKALAPGGALAAVAAWWASSRKTRRVRETWKSHQRAYNKLNTISAATPVERVIVVRASNHGGRASFGTDATITILAEVFGKLPSVITEYRERPLDRQYAEMLADLFERREMVLIADELEDGFLKRRYEADGVKQSRLRLISVDENQMTFVAAQQTCIGDWTPAANTAWDDCIAALALLLQEVKP